MMQNVADVYPLSPFQEGILLSGRGASRSNTCAIQVRSLLEGNLDVALFKRAWQKIIQRHPALRTAFVWQRADRPLQVVFKEIVLPWQEHDLRGLRQEQQERQLCDYLQREQQSQFPPAQAPLMRLALFHLGHDQYQFVWSGSRLCLDRRSIEIICQDVFAHYRAGSEGREEKFPLPPAFRDFIAWLQSQDKAAAEAFWRSTLKDVTPAVLPGVEEQARGPNARAQYGNISAKLDRDVTRRLQAAARQHGLALHTFVQGAWALLLSWKGRSRNVVFGLTLPLHPLTLPGADALAGPLVNTLPLCIGVDRRRFLLDWLREVEERQLQIKQYGYSSCGEIRRWRGISETQPLFESHVVLEDHPSCSEVQITGDLKVVSRQVFSTHSYPLTLCFEVGAELLLHLEFDESRFVAEVTSSLMTGCQRLLSQLAANCLRNVGEISPVDPADEQQLLAGGNGDISANEQNLAFANEKQGGHRSGVLVAAPTEHSFWAERKPGPIVVPENLIPRDCQNIRPQMLPLVELSEQEIEKIVRGVPGGAKNVQDIYPLAPLQEGILFHHLMGEKGDPYLLTSLASLSSRALMEQCVNALRVSVDRHDILRTSVAWEGLRAPVQVVWRKAVLPVEEVVLDQDGEPAQQLSERYNPQHYRIDVRQAPWLRVYIAHDKQQGRWLMLLLLHHLAGDHSTLAVLEQEVEAHLLGRAARLPRPQPFRDLVAQAILEVSQEEHERFFRQMLGDVEEPTLPFGLVNVQGDGTGIAEAHMTLDRSVSLRVRQGARKLGVSPAALFHLVWALVLSKVSGRNDVVFGTVLFGRMGGGSGSERGMGLFINTLPIRIQLGEEMEVSARRTHQVLAELMQHEHALLPMAQRCSNVPSSLPLFSALLNYRNVRSGERSSSQAKRTWAEIQRLGGRERTNYPCTLSIDSEDEGIRLFMQTASVVDPNRMCSYMSQGFESLVEALESKQATMVCALDVLPEKERRQVLYEWNATETEYRSRKCVHELFEEQMARRPQAVAVECAGQEMSYAELNRRANQLAHHLRKLGVGPEVRVGICLERSFEMVVGLLGIIKAGGCYLPLDPSHPPERLNYSLADAQVPVLLIQASLHSLFSGYLGKVLALDEHWDRIATESEANLENTCSLENLVYVIYTSGSTGRPKGVMNVHGGLCNRLLWMQQQYGLDETDRVLQKTAFTFDVSVWEFFWPLITGARLVIAQPGGHQDPDYISAIIQGSQITTLHFVPPMLSVWLDCKAAGRCSTLKRVICSGEVLSIEVQKKFHTTLGAQLHNLYGPTEVSIDVTFWHCQEDRARTSVPIGRPIANTQVYVLDPDWQPVPVGVQGELYLGGRGLARGYLNRPQLTAEKFVPHPFSHARGDRLYRTGDLVKWQAEGELEFLGRLDDQVKLRGFRIELGEIEAALLDQAGVKQAVVVMREDHGDKQLVAYVVIEGERQAEELSEELHKRLPKYMVPAAFVRLEKLPLTSNGKLDRRSLPAPGGTSGGIKRGYVAPRTPTEQALAQVWSEVLHRERVGIEDNFFMLGGHSLLATQAVARVNEKLNCRTPLRQLFDTPTIAGFARTLEQQDQGEVSRQIPPLTRSPQEKRGVLSYSQQRLWFIEQLTPGRPVYHMPVAVRILGPLDAQALQQTLNEIVCRHESLRTHFGEVDGEPRQIIDPPAEHPLICLDLSYVLESEREAEAERIALEEIQMAFDLKRGPLFRVKLLQLFAEDHLLVTTMHHIISDGWSIGVLMHEVTELYRAFNAGELSPLPELLLQYSDYAAWQRAWLTGEVLEKQLSYWKQQLAGVETLNLPTDRPRPALMSHRGAVQNISLAPKVTEDLKRLGQSQGTTLYMTLLAAFQVLLARYSGQQDIAVGSPIAGRARTELEGLIGFFVNTLVLRGYVCGDMTFSQLLLQVREITLQAYAHQYAPFEKLVEALQQAPDLSRTPLFQVMFVLHNTPEPDLKLGAARLIRFPLNNQIAQFDLILSLSETTSGLEGSLIFSTDIFAVTTIERMIAHWQVLLRSLAAEPDRRMSELNMLSEAERSQLLIEWTRTQTVPVGASVHERFAAQAQRTPASPALSCAGRRLTYSELDQHANRLAASLRRLGVGLETRVAVCLERSLETVIAILGILKAGAAYVPLDSDYPAERLSYILEDSQAAVLITGKGMIEEALAGYAGRVLEWENEEEDVVQETGFDEMRVHPENAAYVIYTSGSTGRPKGVVVTHANVVRLMERTETWFGFNAQDVVTLFHSYAFDLSVWEIWSALHYGGRLVVVPYWVSRSPEDFLDLLIQEGVTVLNQTPSAFQQLMLAEETRTQRPGPSDGPEKALSDGEAQGERGLNLRVVIFGDEALDYESLRPWLHRHGHQPQLVNMHGITETTVHVTYRPIMQRDVEEKAGCSGIGIPIQDLKVYVLNEWLQPVPVGVKGELYVGGPGVARGYLNRAELTAQRFVPNPYAREAGERLYRSGDQVSWRIDGSLDYYGRLDQQVKVRGSRIELGEIEAVLRELQGVKQAAVAIREDHGDKQLVAYVVLEGDQKAEDLPQELHKRLPEYMVPAACLKVERLPITAHGKLDRPALPALARDVVRPEQAYLAPSTPTEQVLAQIWSEILHRDHVGIHDDFFSIGGHSLQAARVVARLRDAFEIDVPLPLLFQATTIAKLAEAIEQLKERNVADTLAAVLPRIERADRDSIFVLVDED